MAKLGSKKRPAIVRVQTRQHAEQVIDVCNAHGWHFIVGVEPDLPEDLTELDRLLNPPTPRHVATRPGRNDPCPCGSGRKYKRCCLSSSAQVEHSRPA